MLTTNSFNGTAHGNAHGHHVQPISTGWQWSAFGPKGRREGKASTKELALLDAIKAEVELT